jgi:hypothetical protein
MDGKTDLDTFTGGDKNSKKTIWAFLSFPRFGIFLCLMMDIIYLKINAKTMFGRKHVCDSYLVKFILGAFIRISIYIHNGYGIQYVASVRIRNCTWLSSLVSFIESIWKRKKITANEVFHLQFSPWTQFHPETHPE